MKRCFKKLSSVLLVLVALLFISSSYALEPEGEVKHKDDIRNQTFVIGMHVFELGQTEITLEAVMDAARTIKSGPSTIFYKDFNGNWVNVVNDIEVPDYFVISRINGVDIVLDVTDIEISPDYVEVNNIPNNEEVEITMSTPTAQTEIRYTIDGSTPTKDSLLYDDSNKPIISASSQFGDEITIKAIGFREGRNPSDVTELVLNFNTSPEINVTSIETFIMAIENKDVNLINVEEDLVGDVSATRIYDTNLEIDFKDNTLEGNLSIVANNITELTLNGTAENSIDGDLTVTAEKATVLNNINVSGDVNVEAVGDDSWYQNGKAKSIRFRSKVGRYVHTSGELTEGLKLDVEEVVAPIVIKGNLSNVRVIVIRPIILHIEETDDEIDLTVDSDNVSIENKTDKKVNLELNNNVEFSGEYEKKSGEGNVIVKAAAPIIEPGTSKVSVGTEVTITSQEGTVVYYTLDGSNPTDESLVYDPLNKPIVSPGITIKAFAYSEESHIIASEIVEETYLHPTLEGEIFIDGIYEFGYELEIDLSLISYDPVITNDELTYSWYKNGDLIEGQTTSTLMLTEEYIGSVISARVKSDDIHAIGYIYSPDTPVISKRTNDDVATIPTLSEITKTTISLNDLGEEYEYAIYSIDGILESLLEFKTSPLFENLEPDTEYVFISRIKETETHTYSSISEASEVFKTKPLSSDSNIVSFSLESQVKDALIDQEENKIYVEVSSEANITELIATFETSEYVINVLIGDVVQESGITKNDYSDAVIYRVIAEDESYKEYEVIVIIVDKDGLSSKIDEATQALENILISIDGTDILIGEHWVTEANYEALANEIAEATATLNDSGKTQEQVDQALLELTNKLNTFNSSIEEGTLIEIESVEVSFKESENLYVEITYTHDIRNFITDASDMLGQFKLETAAGYHVLGTNYGDSIEKISDNKIELTFEHYEFIEGGTKKLVYEASLIEDENIASTNNILVKTPEEIEISIPVRPFIKAQVFNSEANFFINNPENAYFPLDLKDSTITRISYLEASDYEIVFIPNPYGGAYHIRIFASYLESVLTEKDQILNLTVYFDEGTENAHTEQLTITAIAEQEFYVSATGDDENEGSIESPFKTIQRAINAANSNDAIHVLEGTYEEDVMIPKELNDLMIIGTSQEEVIIDGNLEIENIYEPEFIFPENVVISSLRITKDVSIGSGATLEDVKIDGNLDAEGGTTLQKVHVSKDLSVIGIEVNFYDVFVEQDAYIGGPNTNVEKFVVEGTTYGKAIANINVLRTENEMLFKDYDGRQDLYIELTIPNNLPEQFIGDVQENRSIRIDLNGISLDSNKEFVLNDDLDEIIDINVSHHAIELTVKEGHTLEGGTVIKITSIDGVDHTANMYLKGMVIRTDNQFWGNEFTTHITIDSNNALEYGAGNLKSMAFTSDTTLVLYERDGSIYVNRKYMDNEWGIEHYLGRGTEGDVLYEDSNNIHIVFTTEDGKLAYTVFNGHDFSSKIYIESNDAGPSNEGNLKWPSISLKNGTVQILYVDTEGQFSGTHQQSDVMLATLDGGQFNKTVLYHSSYDSGWKNGTYFGEKKPLIDVDSNGNNYILFQRRAYSHSGYVYHDRQVMLNNKALTNSSNNNNRFDLYDIKVVESSIYALYRFDSNMILSRLEIEDESGTLSDHEILKTFPNFGNPTFDKYNEDILIVTNKSGNLAVYHNELEKVYENINLVGDVFIEHYNGNFYAVYQEASSNLIKRVLIEKPLDPTPSVENVFIEGEFKVLETLTGTYDFIKNEYENDEGQSIYRWLISDEEEGQYEYIDGAEQITYLVQETDQGKYIKFEVQPVDVEQNTGDKYLSDPVLIEELVLSSETGLVRINEGLNQEGTKLIIVADWHIFDTHEVLPDGRGRITVNASLLPACGDTEHTLTFAELKSVIASSDGSNQTYQMFETYELIGENVILGAEVFSEDFIDGDYHLKVTAEDGSIKYYQISCST